jgi:hypothetical protein
MKTNGTVIDIIFAGCALASVIILHDIVMLFLIVFLTYTWEDSKWPSFDAKDYDDKLRILKPWHKGN